MVFVFVQLHKYFEDGEYVYLVLEKCDLELDSYLKANRTRLDEEEARHYMKQIIDGLLYLHKYNLLHRDVTLPNLLLTKDMNIVNIIMPFLSNANSKFRAINILQCYVVIMSTLNCNLYVHGLSLTENCRLRPCNAA